jgi:hypothetical protein
VQGFLRDFRNANAGTTIYLIWPHSAEPGGPKSPMLSTLTRLPSLMPTAHLIDITDMDATLTEDLNGDASYSTYSYDGLHPEPGGA